MIDIKALLLLYKPCLYCGSRNIVIKKEEFENPYKSVCQECGGTKYYNDQLKLVYMELVETLTQ